MSTTDLQIRNERLAAENERIRVALGQVRDRMQNSPHVVMPDGQTVHEFCRKALIGVHEFTSTKREFV